MEGVMEGIIGAIALIVLFGLVRMWKNDRLLLVGIIGFILTITLFSVLSFMSASSDDFFRGAMTFLACSAVFLLWWRKA